MRHPVGVFAFIILHSALLAALLAAARQDQPQRPVFRTEANYVRIDVFPTRDEQPVPDLTQAEFEIFEDKITQKIDAFERVVISPAGPQETRREPNTVAESRAMAQDPRARVFVLFLDTYHVTTAASHAMRDPLVRMLQRMIGPDDLVGLMTPEMSAKNLTLARRTQTIEGILSKDWTWGKRDSIAHDPEEDKYEACYPEVMQPRSECQADVQGVAREMTLRRREKRTLDAIQDLVRHLQGLREERKAVITVSEGWTLSKPDDRLARKLECRAVPGGQPLFVGLGGKLTTTPKDDSAASQYECDRDRLEFSRLDNEQQFRRILDEANRATASFYTIDPRGLAVFDESINTGIGNGRPLGVIADAQQLGQHLTSLRTLAEATDGLAIVSSNDLDRGVNRIVSDLSSYYLLGYYSTNAKLDGKFRSITVRVKRPGVQVRARRGYLAPTAAEVAARAPAPVGDAGRAAAAEAHAVSDVVAPLARVREVPLRLQVAAGWKAGEGGPTAVVWAVGEFGAGDEWRGGGDADVTLTNAADAAVATAHAHIDPGARSFRVALPAAGPLDPGEYAVRVRAKGAGASSVVSNDTVRFTLLNAPEATGAVFIRRGPSTANKEVATADPRYRRSEQIRVEVPAPASGALTARLLDRTGKPLAVPVGAAVRDDADGSRWQTAQLALAPLAVGDYVIELASGSGQAQKRTLVAFRVVP